MAGLVHQELGLILSIRDQFRVPANLPGQNPEPALGDPHRGNENFLVSGHSLQSDGGDVVGLLHDSFLSSCLNFLFQDVSAIPD